jgi:type VI secretion system protein VasD
MKCLYRIATAIAWTVSLAGCSMSSMFSAPPADVPVKLTRQLHVTLIGGGYVNASLTGQPRPIQACVYLARLNDWLPASPNQDSTCAVNGKGEQVIADSRHIVAPYARQQFWLDLPETGTFWLVTDADYAVPPPHYAPLRIRVDGEGQIRKSILLDHDGLSDVSNTLEHAKDPQHVNHADSQSVNNGTKRRHHD